MTSLQLTSAQLAVRGIEAGYGDVQVLWGIDLDVRSGEIVCVIGSNGAGKSTLLRAISGLVRARAGSVAVGERDLTNAGPKAVLAAGVAHVPEGRRLFSAMSVEDNLKMGAYLRHDHAEVRRDLAGIYETFPILGERRRQDAGTLSGGEQQMCAIGRGIMGRPRLLMIDELSLGLAPVMVEMLSAALLRIREAGVAILLVEQDVLAALGLADRAFVIDRGRVVLAGPSATLAKDPKVREAYLGVA
jgi:branched-chain amino acid transport system ATP-binding protein